MWLPELLKVNFQFHVDGIFLIGFPLAGIVMDVFADAVQFGLIPDDVFVIIPLPDGLAGGAADLVDLFGGIHFKIPDHFG